MHTCCLPVCAREYFLCFFFLFISVLLFFLFLLIFMLLRVVIVCVLVAYERTCLLPSITACSVPVCVRVVCLRVVCLRVWYWCQSFFYFSSGLFCCSVVFFYFIYFHCLSFAYVRAVGVCCGAYERTCLRVRACSVSVCVRVVCLRV